MRQVSRPACTDLGERWLHLSMESVSAPKQPMLCPFLSGIRRFFCNLQCGIEPSTVRKQPVFHSSGPWQGSSSPLARPVSCGHGEHGCGHRSNVLWNRFPVCALTLMVGTSPHHRAFDRTIVPIRDDYGGGDSMVDALVGIAATIYIFKFIIALFKPNPAIWRCSQVDGGCGYGPEQACGCSDEAKELWIRQGCKEFHLERSS